jgi:hypothetical protein
MPPHVSVRYNATTGQPLVVRVAEDDAPPLTAEQGEAVAITTVEEYKKARSHDEFVKAVHPKVKGWYDKKAADEQADADAQFAASLAESQAAFAAESDPTE